MKLLVITILSLVLFHFSSDQILASGILFFDDFNQPLLKNWSVERNQQWTSRTQPCLKNNETAHWENQGSALALSIDGPQCITEIIPRFLDLTWISSYQVDVDMTFSKSIYADRYILFGWHNAENQYYVHFSGQTVSIEKVVNNSYETLENSFRYPFQPDQTYHFTVIFKNRSQIILKINDRTEIEFPDSPATYFGSNSVGLQAGNWAFPKSETVFDNFTVRSLDPGINLSVTSMKQSDPMWASEEYDSAKKWATPSDIKSWGCSLTSMVMILKYYGVYFLPNDQFVTPSTLNVWLLSQEDGYVGDGLLNWLAISRMTREVHDTFKTPKLEFTRYEGNLLVAKDEIQHQRPVILKIDGHFLVSDGITENEQDLLIKDPSYAYTSFSEHHQELRSVLSFTPSYTDLSYLFIVHQPGLQLKVFDEHGAEVSGEISAVDYLQSLESTSPQWEQHYFPKPSDGQYIIQVSAHKTASYSFQLFTYQQDGTVTTHKYIQYFTQEPKYFVLTYKKNSEKSELSQVIDFTSLRHDLEIGQETGLFRDRQIGNIFWEEAHYAERSSENRQKRYLFQLKALLEKYAAVLDSHFFLIIENDLKAIELKLNAIISR